MSDNKVKDAYRLVEAAGRSAKTRQGRNQVEYVEINSAGYAEPGYSGDVIALANWNRISKYDPETRNHDTIDDIMPRLCDALEKIGVEIEWSDEWSDCSGCSKLVRTSPNSYGWKASYKIDDSELLCVECLQDDPEEYLRSLEGNHRTANTIDEIDPAEHGYVLVEKDYEHGFHRGQDADPKLVAAALEKQGISRYLFQIDDVGQFDLSFSVYVHEDEADLLDKDKFAGEKTDGPSVSAAMERGLREASAKMAELPDGQGIKYAKIGMDGADVRLVSPEEFVRGIGNPPVDEE